MWRKARSVVNGLKIKYCDSSIEWHVTSGDHCLMSTLLQTRQVFQLAIHKYRGFHTWSVLIDFCIYVHVHLIFYMVEGRVSTRSGMCCPCCLQSSTNMNRWLHRRTQLHSFHLKCAIKHLRRLVRSCPTLNFISCGCQMSVWAVRYSVREQCIPVMTVSPS